MASEEIVQSIRNYLHRLQKQGMPIAFGVLYGSFARGDNHADSDVDLVVVSPRFDGNQSWRDKEILWETTITTDNPIKPIGVGLHPIEPIGVGLKRWHEDDSSPLIEIVRQEGEIIHLT